MRDTTIPVQAGFSDTAKTLELQDYYELTLAQTAKIRELKAENAKLQLALKKACDMLPACPDELGRLDDMFLRAAERDLRELEG